MTSAVHITGWGSVDEARRLHGVCTALHLDSRTQDRLGGTGRTHDWAISRRIRDEASEAGIPTILSGGLNCSNVIQAIRAVRPHAVDANSGVEDPSGGKSKEETECFIRMARGA